MYKRIFRTVQGNSLISKQHLIWEKIKGYLEHNLKPIHGENIKELLKCGCKEAVYVEKTWNMFEKRKKEHHDRVRITKQKLKQREGDCREKEHKG